MRNLILLLVTLLILSCSDNSKNNASIQKDISVASIESEMSCENCGMNLKKYISTSHALELNNDESHFYCSINCSSIALGVFGEKVKTVYGIDYGLTRYFQVKNLSYVIGSDLKGTMTEISKFAFRDIEKAKNFKKTFNGKSITDYQNAYNMSLGEISERAKSK